LVLERVSAASPGVQFWRDDSSEGAARFSANSEKRPADDGDLR